ncbi:NgoMIV family type II restriction endonuclease [Qipengyuania sp. GH1]|uniref:NgoMIV family type II restriction endonuclease n=1 Tax=Qipengyuania aestuarii TaxID=2867241 RepID=UPI001C885ACD|nr:NgoMIV family type II restriction endonuclease [Qipengyuania aestuarii]MBX7535211.1 NgoMIV family type II restriction endonuclease [Qipengyuania aestuarii]
MMSLKQARDSYHQRLTEEILHFVHTQKHDWNARNADASNTASKEIANSLAVALGASQGTKIPGQTVGTKFEEITADFLRFCFSALSHLQPGVWKTERETSRSPLVIARFSQYSHLKEVYEASKDNPELAAVLGRDYSVASDVLVYRERLDDQIINSKTEFVSKKSGRDHLRAATAGAPYLHASISCKWTIRSDRAQNTRTEALDLIRKRKGRVPHIVAVTAEPLPSRLSSLCLGTGDLDCVYHFALPELVKAVGNIGQSEATELLELMIESERIKDIADLPLDLLL